MGKGGSVSAREGSNVEDGPGNPGAAEWPNENTAYFAVRRMQTKLHGWAGADRSRRFDDLFNLVYDRAFLMHAWERVSSNAGARTPGFDRATVARIEAQVGVVTFLEGIRESLKSGGFRPVEVRQVMIPKGSSGKLRKLGIPRSRRRPGRSNCIEGGARACFRGGLLAVLVRVSSEPAYP